MAAFNKFNKFTEDVLNGVHNFSTNTFVIALTNVAPVATNSILADLTQISYTNLSSRDLTGVSVSQTGGVSTVNVSNLVLTASGTVGPFRYAAIYNDSTVNKNLICWYDRGQSDTLLSGDTMTFDFPNEIFDLT
jgi:hypothetical protein